MIIHDLKNEFALVFHAPNASFELIHGMGFVNGNV